jgi:steroid delta-isomerase-like uncharacterized protein
MTSERRQYFERYTEGWNDHDPDVVVEQFAPGGTYVDPAVGEPLGRREIGEFVAESVTGFPDVRFEVRRVVTAEEGAELVLVAEWTMRGTHAGPFEGVPPTGNEIELDGADVVTVSDDGITSITGYFDQRAFVEQLGLTFPAVVGQLPALAVGAVEQRLS